MATNIIAKSGASCQRCHRRKKKCDRTLPECEACRDAGESCSFLDDDSLVGTYSIAYVTSLEDKINQLEKDLSAVINRRSTQSTAPQLVHSPVAQLNGIGFSTFTTIDAIMNTDDVGPTIDEMVEASNDILSPSTHTPGVNLDGYGRSPSLDEGLKLLSLEATAQNHLGSSSGLSFARLTQRVLRRLSPDKAEFVFGNQSSATEVQNMDHGFASPSSTFLEFSNALFRAPTLIGDFPLATITDSGPDLESLPLPDETRLIFLVDFYFAHTHTLYPIIRRDEFSSLLKHFLANPADPLAQSPFHLFRLWMVIAIGSTTYSSISLDEESESMLYYRKAMSYFEAALERGNIAALEVLMLQVCYSFFNQVGPNTWFLVGLSARMAVGIGLHTSSTYADLPLDIVEHYKRIFFSVYMMDRVVSIALGRPFALHDDDIDVLPFTGVDDSYITSDGIQVNDPLQPSTMAIPLHILSLRMIASDITKHVYPNATRAAQKTPQEREGIMLALHKRLIDWRRNMPFPLPDVHPQVPQMCSTWYDFNYYTHVAMLYRPSPLNPTLDVSKVNMLASAAAMSIRQATSMRRQERFAYNWLNFLTMFVATLSLIYAITVRPENLFQVLQETKAIDDLQLAVDMFDALSCKFLAGEKIKKMVEDVIQAYEDLAKRSENDTVAHMSSFEISDSIGTPLP